MSNSLFEDFPLVSSKQWKQKIQFDLKGADYNSSLLSETNEGITIKPFYHKDSLKQLTIPNIPSSFKICQTIFIDKEKTANFLAKDALKRGANSIKFIANKPFEEAILLEKLFSSNSEIIIEFQFLDEEFLLKLLHFIHGKNVVLIIDLIGNLVKTGNWFFNHKKDYLILKNLLQSKNANAIIGIDIGHYQNSGANIIQQIAYALSHANEYLNTIETLENTKLETTFNFNFSIGGNYFFEIAKLRAFRYLWNLLIKEYSIKVNANVFAQPSIRNKTIYDYNTNMLRTSTECMSAILGGANTISNVSYDTVFHKKNEFGERISRNQLIILQVESYLKNADFVTGTYYIEELTYEIVEKSLELFKSIEKSGGFIKQLFDGTIQRKIEESAQKEQSQFDNEELILLGVNRHPNKEDRMKNNIELYPFLKKKSRETLLKPIIVKRLADKIEQERLVKESN